MPSQPPSHFLCFSQYPHSAALLILSFPRQFLHQSHSVAIPGSGLRRYPLRSIMLTVLLRLSLLSLFHAEAHLLPPYGNTTLTSMTHASFEGHSSHPCSTTKPSNYNSPGIVQYGTGYITPSSGLTEHSREANHTIHLPTGKPPVRSLTAYHNSSRSSTRPHNLYDTSITSYGGTRHHHDHNQTQQTPPCSKPSNFTRTLGTKYQGGHHTVPYHIPQYPSNSDHLLPVTTPDRYSGSATAVMYTQITSFHPTHYKSFTTLTRTIISQYSIGPFVPLTHK